jgi:uncharacterized protein (DUF3084 family)
MMNEDKNVGAQNTQIALIHRELKSIADHLSNLDKILTMIPIMDKTLTTQQNILESQERRLLMLEKENTDVHNRIQSLKDQLRDDKFTNQQTIVDKLDNLVSVFETKFKEKEDRIRQLENWRYYILGIIAAGGLLLSGIPWKIVFS